MKIKKILREQARNKYTEWSDEEKNVKREYGRNRYHNMSNLKENIVKQKNLHKNLFFFFI